LYSINKTKRYIFLPVSAPDSSCTISFGTIFKARGATKLIKVTANPKDHTAFCNLDVGIEDLKGVFSALIEAWVSAGPPSEENYQTS
jgi:hypothetical protein